MTTAHTLTILTARHGKRAAKTFTLAEDGTWSQLDYDAGATFTLATAPVPDLAALSALLSEIQSDRRSFIIRGARIDGVDDHGATARTIKDHDGTPPHLHDVDRAWLCVDIDALPVPTDPDGKPQGDRAAWVRYAVATLPAPFHDAGYHYQWSSSAGVKGWATIKLHLWFMLDRPACSRSLRGYFDASRAPVDVALYSANQIHYTAAPIFRDADGTALPDLLGLTRCGLHDGPPVTLPPDVLDLAAHNAQEAARLAAAREAQAALAASLARRRLSASQTDAALARYVEAALRSASDQITAASHGDRHRTLYAAAAALGELVAAQALTRTDAEATLTTAALAAYAGEDREDDARRTIREGLDVGERSPRDLSHVGALMPSVPPRETAFGGTIPNQRSKPALDRQSNDPSDDDTPYPDDAAPPPGAPPTCDLGPPRTDPDAIYDLTDEGDGQRLLAAYGHALRFIADRDQWAIYREADPYPHWEIDHGSSRAAAVGHLSRVCAVVAHGVKHEGHRAADKARARRMVQELERGASEIQAQRAADKAHADILRAYTAHHRRATSVEGRNTTLAVASALPELRTLGHQWDAEPHLLGVTNGCIDLRTGALLPPDRRRLMVRRCPTAYDPAAVCPVFDDFITDITRAQDGLSTPQAADKRAFLLRWLGYCLTGECSEQKFITLTGNGSNGKGVLTNIMVDILGDAVNGGYSDWIDFSTLAHGNRTAGQASPDLAKLPGVRYVITSEPSRGTRYDEGRVKRMTGQDLVTARALWGNEFSYKPVYKINVQCNDKPVIDGQDLGIWRRVLVLCFDRQRRTSELMPASLPAPDLHLPSKLQAERVGILAQLVRAAVEWYASGLRVPRVVADAVAEYRAESDSFALFLAECCDLGADLQAPSGPLGAAYNDWAKRTKSPTLSARAFSDEMKRRGFIRRDTGSCNRWLGVALRPDAPPAHDDSDAPF